MTKLKRSLTYGFAFSAMLMALASAQPSGAQTANSSSSSASGATAGSSSGSGAAAIINQTTNVPSNTTSTNTYNSNERVSGGTQNSVNQSGHVSSDSTFRTTPTVYAPPVSGGNPCTLAVSGGVSVIGWGAAAGGTFVDQDCANRQKIAMVHNAGYQQAARELMCNDRDTYMAFRYSATPCAPRAAFDPPGAPQPVPPMVQRPVPAPTPVVMTAPKEYPRCNARLGINDNCRS